MNQAEQNASEIVKYVQRSIRGAAFPFEGVVTSTSPLTVKKVIEGDDGKDIACSTVSNYTPIEDDVVFVIRYGNRNIILDTVA